MKRNCSLEDISDGKLYDINDMVKAACNECSGCSACCRGMGKSIILDPYDVFRLCYNLKTDCGRLLAGVLELNVVDGIILPNISMTGESNKCAFLDNEGRCSIHQYRPGICRLFPLGRYYENNDFKYFLQTDECKKDGRTKVKVIKWIDTPLYKENKKFILNWHFFLNEVEERIKELSSDEAFAKNANMYILNKFFINPLVDNEFGAGDFEAASKEFYKVFDVRINEARKVVLS